MSVGCPALLERPTFLNWGGGGVPKAVAGRLSDDRLSSLSLPQQRVTGLPRDLARAEIP